MSLLTPDAATEQERRQLLKRLARLRKNWPREPALRDLSPRMIEALQEYVDMQNNARRSALVIIAAMTFAVLVAQTVFKAPPFWIDAGLMTAYVYATGYKPGTEHRYAVYALTQINDIRALPTLIKATNVKWGMHPEVLGAVRRLLPQITEGHIGLLDQKAQERLWHLAIAPLNYERECDEALACAALNAFIHVGNRETLNRMRNFVLHMTFYPAQRRVTDALEQAILLMEARLQRQEVPETLLRAAETPHSQTEILLRPAKASTSEPPDQLLRAGTQDK